MICLSIWYIKIVYFFFRYSYFFIGGVDPIPISHWYPDGWSKRFLRQLFDKNAQNHYHTVNNLTPYRDGKNLVGGFFSID